MWAVSHNLAAMAVDDMVGGGAELPRLKQPVGWWGATCINTGLLQRPLYSSSIDLLVACYLMNCVNTSIAMLDQHCFTK